MPCAAGASAATRSRSVTATRAPSRTKVRTMPMPIPGRPVTKAFLPLSSLRPDIPVPASSSAPAPDCHRKRRAEGEAAASGGVGNPVSAAATARPRDFRGLVRLEEAAGDRFACGIVRHDGKRVQQTDSGLFAMPVKMLWEARETRRRFLRKCCPSLGEWESTSSTDHGWDEAAGGWRLWPLSNAPSRLNARRAAGRSRRSTPALR